MSETSCTLCGSKLEPIFSQFSRRKDDEAQFVDALHIEISGGYGEYFDGRVAVVLCKECAGYFEDRNSGFSVKMREG